MRRAILVGLTLIVVAGACALERASDDRVMADRITQQADPTPTSSPTAAPSDVQPYRFVAIGDWGAGTSEQDRIGQRMCSYRKHHPFDDVITAGDNIYPNGRPLLFRTMFYRPFACLLNHGVDFHASLGNHDVMTNAGRGEINEPRFGIDHRNYVFREGGVRFVVWDSNSRDREWLRDALKPKAGDEWTIAVFHHPVFSPGTGHGSEPGFRPALPRLFHRKGVDLVLNGHDHIYSVSEPKKGIRYVVTGGGGAGLYGCTQASFVDVCEAEHHFLYVKVFPDEMRVAAVPRWGKPIDTFTVRH